MTTPTPTNCPICNGPMPCLKHFRAYAAARSRHVGTSPKAARECRNPLARTCLVGVRLA